MFPGVMAWYSTLLFHGGQKVLHLLHGVGMGNNRWDMALHNFGPEKNASRGPVGVEDPGEQ